jgi:hypothetical protein
VQKVNVNPGRPCHPWTAHEPGTTLEHTDSSFAGARRPPGLQTPSARNTCSMSTEWVQLLYNLYGLGGSE